MTDFEKIKEFRDAGIYSNKHIAAFVSAGVLSEEEYTALTGIVYSGGEAG